MIDTTVHQGQPTRTVGATLQEADQFIIMLHGRGATADSMLPLAETLHNGKTHFAIPQAALNRWYPNSAFTDLAANEPDLSSALARIDSLVEEANHAGFKDSQIMFGGFSQGACLAAEYVARNARPYGGLFVFSGALIGPPGTPRQYPGSFENMPVFIGSSDVDPWVPYELIVETAEVFTQMGAQVDFQTYPGMAHTINEDELNRVQAMLAAAG